MPNLTDLPRNLWTPLSDLSAALEGNEVQVKPSSGRLIKTMNYTRPETGETVNHAIVSVGLEDGRRMYFSIWTDGQDESWKGVKPGTGETFKEITPVAVDADTCVRDLVAHSYYA